MRTAHWLLGIALCALSTACQPGKAVLSAEDEAAIREVMAQQVSCWNAGDLACYMEGYWRSDSLKFIGRSGLSYGWQTTLDNYEKGYPDRAAMGTLSFDILTVEALATDAVLLLGKWRLDRQADTLSGHYSLVWRKINNQWVIVTDHSSS